MLSRNEVIKILCERYKINAAMAQQTYSIVLDNKQYKHRRQLFDELNYYEELGGEHEINQTDFDGT